MELPQLKEAVNSGLMYELFGKYNPNPQEPAIPQELLEEAHRQMHVGVTVEPDDLYDDFTHQIHHKVGELIHDRAYEAHIPAHWASIKLIEGDQLVEKALLNHVYIPDLKMQKNDD